jgi:hypothetical protein
MREQINHVDFHGQTYGVTEDVRAYQMEILHADGTVGATCENFVASSRVLAAHMAHWSECHAENGTMIRLREQGPHFQRSVFPSFEVNLLLRRDLPKLVEARKVWEQYIG